MTRTNVFLLFE